MFNKASAAQDRILFQSARLRRFSPSNGDSHLIKALDGSTIPSLQFDDDRLVICVIMRQRARSSE
jgi:hypothetical protein